MRLIHVLVCVGLVLLPAVALGETYEEKVVAQGGKKMTNPDLTSLFSKSLVWNFQVVQLAFWNGTVTYKPGGSAVAAWNSQDASGMPTKGEDTGTLRIDGDRVCGKWKGIAKGEERCAYWYRMSDARVVTVNATTGAPGTYIDFKP